MGSIILTYHYVRDNSNMKCITVNKFHNQIEMLSKQYKFVTLSELIKNPTNRPCCVFSFDDGLIDGFNNVLPILHKFGAKGTFFISTSVLLGKMLAAQKRHMLLSKLGPIKFTEEFNKKVSNKNKITSSENYQDYYHRDDVATANLKYHLDYCVGSEEALQKVFSKFFNEKKELQSLYLSENQIKIMLSKGMEIGSHGHTHQHLSRLSGSKLISEITKPQKILKDHFSIDIKTMSYPFGDYNSEVMACVKQCGLIAAVTVIPGNVQDSKSYFELCRVDCADLGVDNGG